MQIFYKIKPFGDVILIGVAAIIFLKAVIVPNALDIILLVILLIYFITCIIQTGPRC